MKTLFLFIICGNGGHKFVLFYARDIFAWTHLTIDQFKKMILIILIDVTLRGFLIARS